MLRKLIIFTIIIYNVEAPPETTFAVKYFIVEEFKEFASMFKNCIEKFKK